MCPLNVLRLDEAAISASFVYFIRFFLPLGVHLSDNTAIGVWFILATDPAHILEGVLTAEMFVLAIGCTIFHALTIGF